MPSKRAISRRTLWLFLVCVGASLEVACQKEEPKIIYIGPAKQDCLSVLLLLEADGVVWVDGQAHPHSRLEEMKAELGRLLRETN